MYQQARNKHLRVFNHRRGDSKVMHYTIKNFVSVSLFKRGSFLIYDFIDYTADWQTIKPIPMQYDLENITTFLIGKWNILHIPYTLKEEGKYVSISFEQCWVHFSGT